jgi:hypothetical protein
MSVAFDTGKEIGTDRRRPPAIIGLAALLGVLVIGALQGGIAMVTDPLQPLGMPVSYLDGMPVTDYFWPGVFLLSIAAASLLTIPGLIFLWEWKWASGIEKSIGHRWPWLGALSIGGVLLVFEVIELFVVPIHPVMHPLLIAGSLAILWLASTPSARGYLEKS